MSTRTFTFPVQAAGGAYTPPSTVGQAELVGFTNNPDSLNNSQGVWNRSAGAQAGLSYIGDYSGGCYNPHYSALGALVCHGGGHAATQENGVYVANFSTLLWEKPGASTDLDALGKFVDYSSAVDNVGIYDTSYDYFIRRGPNSTGWQEANIGNSSLWQIQTSPPPVTLNGCEVAPNTPGSAHTYDSMFILPPQRGGGTKGSLIRATSFAVGTKTSSASGFAHRFDFATQTWSRYTTSAINWETSAGVAYDTNSGRAWLVSTQTSLPSLFYLDTSAGTGTGAFGSVPGASSIDDGGYIDNVLACWHSTRSIAIHATTPNATTNSTKARFYWFSTTANQGTRREVTWTNGVAPPHFAFGSGSLCDIPYSANDPTNTGKVFYWCRADANFYYLITVPADPTQQWPWERRQITGTLPSSLTNQASSVYHRMDYAPALKSVVWAVGGASNVQSTFTNRVLCIRIHN